MIVLTGTGDADIDQEFRRKDPGLLVLAVPPLRVLHANQRAVEIMRWLSAFENHLTNEPSANSFVPAPFLQSSAELFRLTQDRANIENWEQFEIRRIINTHGKPMRVRVVGLPDHGEWDQSRLVVLLEEIGTCEDEVSTPSC
jgi:hypothetical protein